MSDIRFIAGLGNPGTRYESTRHNIGFSALDWIVSHKSLGSWRSGEGLDWIDGKITNKKVFFVKPLTFMNRSGEPLQRFMNFYTPKDQEEGQRGIVPGELLVVHDEIDLPLGTVRLKKGGGEGGHNGVRSISQQLGSSDFIRLRIGVGRPENPNYDVADWVLSRFTKDEAEIAQSMVEQSSRIIESIFEKGIIATQNIYN